MDDTDIPEPASQRLHDDHPIRLGISSCLLGHEVRYDGSHKRDRYLVEILGPLVEWVPICPEIEIGLGVPRPTIQLEGSPTSARLIMPSTGDDLTQTMKTFALKRVRELQSLDLDGFVFKSKSPSCGMERVKVFDQGGIAAKIGVGAFAGILLEIWPDLPVEDEVRLADPELRERFIEQVTRTCRRRTQRTE